MNGASSINTRLVLLVCGLLFGQVGAASHAAVAIQAPGVYLTDPYLDMITNKLVVSVAKKVTYADGKADGAVGIDLFITKVGEIVSSKKLSTNGKTYLINKDGLYITNEKPEAILKDNLFGVKELAGVKNEVLGKPNSFGILAGAGIYYASIVYPGTSWILVSYGPLSDIYGDLYAFLVKVIVIAAFCLLLSGIAAAFMARSISRPIATVTNANLRFAEGDFTLSELKGTAVDRIRRRGDERRGALRPGPPARRVHSLLQDTGRGGWRRTPGSPSRRGEDVCASRGEARTQGSRQARGEGRDFHRAGRQGRCR